jgi:hypothetical protein
MMSPKRIVLINDYSMSGWRLSSSVRPLLVIRRLPVIMFSSLAENTMRDLTTRDICIQARVDRKPTIIFTFDIISRFTQLCTRSSPGSSHVYVVQVHQFMRI